MKFRILVPGLVFIILLFTGCKKDFDFNKVKTGTWQPSLALPLVWDSMTFESGLKAGGGEKHFEIDETTGDISILVYYNDDAFTMKPADLLKIPPYNVPYTHNFTAAEALFISQADFTLPPQNSQINLVEQLPGVRVDKVTIKNGFIRISTNNSFNNSGYYTLSFPQATKNGQPYSITVNGFSNQPTSQVFDLAGVQFDLTDTPSMLNVVAGGLMKKSSSITSNDYISMNFTIQLDTIKWFQGFVGQQVIPMDEEAVEINVFNNAYALGTLWFQDPSANIRIYNSLGVPARVAIQELRAYNENSNVSVDITNQLDNRIFDIPSPLITDTHPTETYIEFNNANTQNGFDQFVNIKPDKVYYKLLTTINPDNTGINFFADTSSFHAHLKVLFPLYGYFDNLTIQDTFDFNLSEQSNVEEAKLRTAITNGMPLMARMQIYFVDENFNKIDSLAGSDNIFIKEAPVDPATHLPYPGQYGVKDTTFIVDHDRVVKLEDARKILVRAVMNSAGGGNQLVRIRANQMLKLQFSALFKISKNLDN